jgi:hypothetical protein
LFFTISFREESWDERKNRVRLKARYLMHLSLAVISVGVILTSLKWPFKTALFPILVSVFLLIGAVLDFVLCLLEKKAKDGTGSGAADFKLSDDIDPAVARRRTLLAFGWVVGFFLLILLLGFPIAIPVMFFFFLKCQAGERWSISLLLTGGALFFFLGLFVWLLNTPFESGWIFDGLKLLGLA